jgi:proteasome accessory factor B
VATRKAKRQPKPVAERNTKLQRWIDLLAALLSRQLPASFEELRRDVPAYAIGDGPTLMRMFERDKDELRAFGVPIESVTFGDPPENGYRLRARDFYLPFLAVATSERPRIRSAVPPAGYRALDQIAFEPDELTAIGDAAARVRALGDPLLSAEVESAMGKLAFDLPADVIRAAADEHVLTDPVDEKSFALLGAALLDRKVVSFDYHAMSTDETTQRTVEPYGLVFLGGHWYLVARDQAHGQLRNFRLSRITGISPNRGRPQSPDYEIPASFHLDEHARSRHAWNLGDEAVVAAVVDFRRLTGATRAASKLGHAVRGSSNLRRFEVRRPDAFARWLLSFGGDAVPIEPPTLADRFRTIVRETLGRYGATQ